MISSKLNKTLKNKLGINISSVLLPKNEIDMQKWAVVACDQYTSEPEYWKEVDDFVGENPSALRLIFPEAYLETENDEQKNQRILSINNHMSKYIEKNIFQEYQDTIILIERTFQNGSTRNGIILAVDLEKYDYTKGSQSHIRATEGTIIDRLPPRIKIRENASLELPHIMLLIDDKEKTVIEPLIKKADTFTQLYSFELMKNSGSIKGWKIDDQATLEDLANSLLKLADPDNFKDRYKVDDKYNVLLFAVGDGNHSLATAKACWENIKKNLTPQELETHPARYALVEVVNLHDNGLVFEPIHRVLFNVDEKDLINEFKNYYKERGAQVTAQDPETKGHKISYVSPLTSGFFVVENPAVNLDVGTLQNFLDYYIKKNPNTNIDYVHGEDVTERLGKKPGNMGFFLSPMDKNELFRTVILEGALPRKTFSMGEAQDKRFYIEARKIK
ncbi:MAG: DUF1015 domain-containing protein [Clostridiaceae bacterium]|nr:DUF1015 domain-containing protein [Clostridiaceae bacterium]